ncbi:hypothetical protein EPI10_030601 [Gossypium australe]|uniref:Uncharacterized protein n=1 Tax=Gossypium australe TaxID=47621 RepID=A0A5B6X0W7_9ROSI|nr:hypothetical protein EPI10_030601 [Gossypium australe]
MKNISKEGGTIQSIGFCDQNSISLVKGTALLRFGIKFVYFLDQRNQSHCFWEQSGKLKALENCVAGMSIDMHDRGSNNRSIFSVFLSKTRIE